MYVIVCVCVCVCVCRHIARAKADGCHAVLDRSDAQPGGANLSGGFFLGPVIFDKCPPAASILHEEVFGPVMCVQGFDTEALILKSIF
jgi:betaine-aldehyde dehydrogenase